ncbi:hypothetical protein GCM10022228_06630 [Halomonas cibimaris]|uniref:Flagellin n=1 Tax=Halomonas cibimaris TaxID=657012 RepID=A0ABP7LEA4_9GAMM
MLEGASGAAKGVEDAMAKGSAATSYAFKSASESVRESMISDQRSDYEKEIADLTATVDKTKGLLSKVNALQNAETALENAAEAVDAAEAENLGEMAKFGKVNGDVTVTSDYQDKTDFVVKTNGGATTYIKVNSDGDLVITADGKGLEGIDALFATAKAEYNTNVTQDNAVDKINSAAEAVMNAEADSTDASTNITAPAVTDGEAADVDLSNVINTKAPDSLALITEQEALVSFNEAVADYTAAKALNDGLDAKDQAITDADEAISELGYELTDGTAGTDDNDLFLYESGSDETITGFGSDGEDRLFIGTDFTFNEGDVDTDGDDSALEVFFTQDGNDVTITLETADFGSNAATQEVDEITLAGVNVDDLQFDGGYIVGGTAADIA